MSEKSDFDKYYAGQDWYYQLDPSEELKDFFDNNPEFVTESSDKKYALDLGCGEGRDSVFLASVGYVVKSIDKSEQGIKKLNDFAESNNLTISAEVHDVTTYTIEKMKYDFINAVTILDHLQPMHIKKLCQDIYIGLKSGGIIFVEVFTTLDPGYKKAQDSSETANFVRHYFEPEELKKMFPKIEIINYVEQQELDVSHGDPHYHGVAILLGQKIDET